MNTKSSDIKAKHGSDFSLKFSIYGEEPELTTAVQTVTQQWTW